MEIMTKNPLPNELDSPIQRLADAEGFLKPLGQDLDHLHRLATMGILAAGVSHEINNLLTPVLAYAEIARANPEDQTLTQKALDKAIAGVEAVTRISESILGYASGGSNSSGYVDINTAVLATIDCLGKRPDKSGIELITRIQPGLTAQISQPALQNVLLNLIINACNALDQQGDHGRKRQSGRRSQSPGGRVTIEANERSDGNVEISVSDTGPGIPDEIAGNLFDPFIRFSHPAGGNPVSDEIDGSRSPSMSGPSEKQGGSGLGLAICRHLIEAASGEISFQSTPGQGTTFTIILASHREPMAKAG